MMKFKVLLFALLVGGVAFLLVQQNQSLTKLRAENQTLREQAEQQDKLVAENERLSKAVVQAERGDGAASELLRLRSEVGMLRGLTNQLLNVREDNRRLQAMITELKANPIQVASQPNGAAMEQARLFGVAKMNDARLLVLGALMHANSNLDRFPTALDQTAPFLRANSDSPFSGTNEFELTYQGALHDIGNPASAIVLREKRAFQSPDGRWARTYGFADGHSEIHVAADGNFDAWEKEHMAAVASGQ